MSQPGSAMAEVWVPHGVIGAVIGRGGETIKRIQYESGAHINVDKNDGMPQRRVEIRGNPDACKRAQSMIQQLVSEVQQVCTFLSHTLGMLGVTIMVD